jgi:hypothetical protein
LRHRLVAADGDPRPRTRLDEEDRLVGIPFAVVVGIREQDPAVLPSTGRPTARPVRAGAKRHARLPLDGFRAGEVHGDDQRLDAVAHLEVGHQGAVARHRDEEQRAADGERDEELEQGEPLRGVTSTHGRLLLKVVGAPPYERAYDGRHHPDGRADSGARA